MLHAVSCSSDNWKVDRQAVPLTESVSVSSVPVRWRDEAEMMSQHGKGSSSTCRFGKWRERRSRVEKDVRRTDRAQAFYRKKSNVRQLQNVLLSYAMYNFDLGYVQARCNISLFALLALVQVEGVCAQRAWCCLGIRPDAQ